eukprot:6177276-Amphidinium_carterae.1
MSQFCFSLCARASANITPCIAIRAPHLCPLAASASHSCALVPFMSAQLQRVFQDLATKVRVPPPALQ